MNAVEFLAQVFVALIALTGPIVVIVRVIAGDGAQLERPQGIREEDPRRWNFGSAS